MLQATPAPRSSRLQGAGGLFPGIDLGLDRAPGTDPATSYALRQRQDDPAGDDFLDRFQELLAFEGRLFPESHPFLQGQRHAGRRPLPLLASAPARQATARNSRRMSAPAALRASFLGFRSVGPMMTYRERSSSCVRKRETSRWRSWRCTWSAPTPKPTERLADLRRPELLRCGARADINRSRARRKRRPTAAIRRLTALIRAEPRPPRRRHQGYAVMAHLRS